jgi:predicted nucleic acid-binding protein
MTFVVDSNIIFSAILNPDNKIGQIIINGSKYFTFITVDQLQEEIENHKDKILKISGLSHPDFLSLFGFIKTKIKFVHHLLISDENYQKAKQLTHGIDSDDLLFVGLSLQYNCKLWSGDKRLINGLHKKGFKLTTTTDEIFQIYLNREFNRRFRQE